MRTGCIASSRVQRLYQDLLGRSVDAGGAEFWSSVLIKSGDDLQLAANLAASVEYYNNASK